MLSGWYNIDIETNQSPAERQKDYIESIPDHLRYYFDFEAYGRDMDIEGTFVETESGYVQLYR